MVLLPLTELNTSGIVFACRLLTMHPDIRNLLDTWLSADILYNAALSHRSEFVMECDEAGQK